MAQGIIYTVSPDGSLQKMASSAPENEDRMQELVAKYPELITDGDGDLLLVRREQGISDSEHGGGRWSLDHLFVTRSAVPVLVELKRAVDTRLRREVVGQMLDYAANATAYWQAGKIAQSFADTASDANMNPELALADFIGDQDPSVFWEQVDANFKAGRIKLVFVADEIPRELARIVEFLNEQMRADVRAVELRWFTSDAGHVSLSPRIIGETERAAAAKSAAKDLSPVTIDDWINQHVAPMGREAATGAASFIASVNEAGATSAVSDQQGSVYAFSDDSDGKPLYPLHLWPGKSGISFSLRWLHKRSVFVDEAVRKQLFDNLTAIVGPLTTKNLKGFPSFPTAALADPEVASKFTKWLRDLLHMSKATSGGV